MIFGYKDNPTNKDTILGPEGILIAGFYCSDFGSMTNTVVKRGLVIRNFVFSGTRQRIKKWAFLNNLIENVIKIETRTDFK